MFSIEWTTDHSIIYGASVLLSAAMGFLAAKVMSSKKIAAAEVELENTLQKLEPLEKERTELQATVKEQSQKVNDQAVELKSLETHIESRNEKIEDLKAQVEQIRSELKLEREAVTKLQEEKSQEGKLAEGLAQKLDEARIHFKDQQNHLKEQKDMYHKLLTEHRQLESQHAELKTTLEKREEHFTEQMQQLNDTKLSLTKEFENLANKIFEEKGKTFTSTSKESIDSMLKPFREQIEGFQKRINEVHDVSLQSSTNLNAEIKKVLEIGLQMSKEANNLTSALKGDSQQRGAWGEAQLRRTLEMSGLIEDTHFEVQSSFRDLEGKQKQTDYIIKLPDNKHIIIDSKVSLNAYDRAVSAETDEQYNAAMAEHIKSVRKHIDDLSKKDYTNLVGVRSPSFVLMFMPIEPAYIEALKQNKDLFEYGYSKNIVLVSHTTLIPILRTVSNLWMMERSNAEAREISEKAGDIYNQVCLVAERLSKLGNTLGTVANHYNGTVKALAGQQGLHGKVERFNQLSAKVSKTMPQLEPTHVDFENERLALIVEEIKDTDDDSTESNLIETNKAVETN